MKVGKRIAQLRAAHGESLREAANRTGVSHTTIARIEKGEVTASLHRTIKLIADGYGVSMDFVLSGKMPPEDVETQFRLSCVEGESPRPVPRQRVEEYIRILRKALQSEIEPAVLETAIEILTLNAGRSGATAGLRPTGRTEQQVDHRVN